MSRQKLTNLVSDQSLNMQLVLAGHLHLRNTVTSWRWFSIEQQNLSPTSTHGKGIMRNTPSPQFSIIWVGTHLKKGAISSNLLWPTRYSTHVIIPPEALPKANQCRPIRKCNEPSVGKQHMLAEQYTRLTNTSKTFFYHVPKLWNEKVSPVQANAPSVDSFKFHFSWFYYLLLIVIN